MPRSKQRAEWERTSYKRMKAVRHKRVFDHYGRVCSRCGFNDIRALTIDHIDQKGCKHRTPSGKRYSGHHLYRRLIRKNLPSGFRTLCCNCQTIVYKEGV